MSEEQVELGCCPICGGDLEVAESSDGVKVMKDHFADRFDLYLCDGVGEPALPKGSRPKPPWPTADDYQTNT